MDDSKKYRSLENVLQEINRRIVLDSEKTKANNSILQELLKIIVDRLKVKDELFEALYERVFYGGSFYDGLKVGDPDEYDLDLLFRLPRQINPVVRAHGDAPGFIDLKLENLRALDEQPTLKEKYRGLEKLYDPKSFHLDTEKVLSWIQSILDKACISNYGEFSIKISKKLGSPAFTLKIDSKTGNLKMDVDLVPCFVFGAKLWPPGFKKNFTGKHEFFIVPKHPFGIPKNTRYWRLSFQEQERYLINSKERLKPALRLLKKLRDTQNHHSISSYFLKTIVMLEADSLPSEFWQKSLSYVFMKFLYKYREHLSRRNIPYYWKNNFNLLGKLQPSNIDNVCNRLSVIIKDIEGHLEDPNVISKYLLTTLEQRKIIYYNQEGVVTDSSYGSIGSDRNRSYDSFSESEIPRNVDSSHSTTSSLNSAAVGIAGVVLATGIITGAATLLERFLNRRND